ncbi:TetR/AcrR family transcriptional regulator [Nocardia concava]|uniref:TetR/AcrR family transcriptional regulator n=1 Tax=Nocardia concava TaxID=257281 RepID=UPI0002DE8F83|nr:TetR/AcrR family transcriptional regulator [Nocardia concava]
MPDEQQLGLRERKKADTRRALSDAALALMFERGLENVVREDIAARAGVSVRTFNNYFAGKYDALVYRQLDRIRRGVEILRSRPAEEPLWDALTTAMVEPLVEELTETGDLTPSREQLVQVRKLVEAPEVAAMMTKGIQEAVIAAIAERTGTDPEHDLYPRLVAAVASAAQQAAFEIYVRSDPPQPIPVLIRQAMAALAAGLPEPPVQQRR